MPARLDQAPITAHVELPDQGEPDLSQLPPRPGVLILEPRGSDGTLLIATTANLRDLARRRLCPDPEQPAGAQIDYRALTARVLGIPVGSGLEADAVYLHQARERLPASYKTVSERWRAWFVHVDPDAEFPQPAKTNLQSGLVAKRSASTPIGPAALPPGLIIGPLPDKDAAGRLIEALIDAFDLCRFHALLVQAPAAAPCAYKEMGRCAAPCDGTEPLPDYRARTRVAIDVLLSGTLAAELETCQAQMRAAATEARFEAAGALKARADRLAALLKPTFAHVARLDRWCVLWILPSPEPGHVRPALLASGELLRLDDQPAADPAAAAARIADQLASAADLPFTPTQDRIDTIGLASRWLFKPAKKRAGIALPITPTSPSNAEIAKAVRAVAAGKNEPEIDALQIEA
ncbi:MAG: hypothetical protein K2Q20_03725 [Phycisphaerales bacterium]|nr:hypothetical protein [Phycisphaerales bacterium]